MSPFQGSSSSKKKKGTRDSSSSSDTSDDGRKKKKKSRRDDGMRASELEHQRRMDREAEQFDLLAKQQKLMGEMVQMKANWILL